MKKYDDQNLEKRGIFFFSAFLSSNLPLWAQRLKADLAAVGIKDPNDIMKGLLMNSKKIRQYVMGVPINKDDWPIIEFDTPKHLYEPTARKNIESMRDCC